MDINQLYQQKLAEGEKKSDINAWLEENGMEIPPEHRETTWTDIGRAGAQGLLFSFGDELEAMVRSGQFSGPEYEQQRDQIRSELQTWQNNHKGASLAAELFGGLGSGGPFAMGAKWLGKKLLKKASPTLFGAIATGASEGALHGAGQANEVSNIPMEALVGGTIGAGATGALGGAERFIQNLNPATAARTEVAQGLRNAGADMNTPIPVGGVIADIPGMGQTFRGAAGNYGPGRNVASDAMRQRLQGMPERVTKLSQDVIGDVKTPLQRQSELAALRKQTANENYGAAMAGSVAPTDDVLSILNTKEGRKAYKGAFDDYNAWHPDDPMDFVKFEDADTVTSMEFWDKAYQRLGDTAGKAKRKGANAQLATTITLRNRLTDAFDKQTDGAYKNARNEFEKLIRQEQAIDYGRQMIKKRDLNPRDIEEYIGALDEFERNEVLRGVMSELEIMAGETVEGGNAARKVMRKPVTVRKIMAAFPDKAEGAEFVETVSDMSRQAAVATDLLSGSRTSPMQAEQNAVKGLMGAAAGGALTGDPTGAVAGAGAGMIKKGFADSLTGLSEKKTAKMVDLMLSPNGETLKDIFTNKSAPSIWAPALSGAGYGAATE